MANNSTFQKKSGEQPGQYKFDVSDKKNVKIVEEKTRLCSPYYSRKYWEAFRDFLNASGAFARTWYLYKQIENDDPEVLQTLVDASNDASERIQIEQQLKAVVDRFVIMKSKQKCETKEELYRKAEDDWNKYKQRLKDLIFYAEKANVPIRANEKVSRNILLSFVLLADEVRGSCRREYFREKYVNRYLRRIEKSGYADPISIYKIEERFEEDKDWQDRFLARKRKKK